MNNQEIAEVIASLSQMFILKCAPLDEDKLTTFALMAQIDSFSASDIKKACISIIHNASIRKVIYADIYEIASTYKKDRLEKEERRAQQERLRLESEEEKAWSNMSEEEKKKYLNKIRGV